MTQIATKKKMFMFEGDPLLKRSMPALVVFQPRTCVNVFTS